MCLHMKFPSTNCERLSFLRCYPSLGSIYAGLRTLPHICAHTPIFCVQNIIARKIWSKEGKRMGEASLLSFHSGLSFQNDSRIMNLDWSFLIFGYIELKAHLCKIRKLNYFTGGVFTLSRDMILTGVRAKYFDDLKHLCVNYTLLNCN